MQNCPVFISSADSYSDLWPVFFDLFKLHWPEFNGVIYLNTEEKEFQSEGLNIVCTQVGKLGHFGKIFRAGLAQIDSDVLLLMMIDYIFMGEVDNARMKKYFDAFLSSDFDAVGIGEFDETKKSDETNLFVPYNHFSYQIAFWQKKVLYEMALPYENPWCSECFGTERSKKMNLKFASIYGVRQPIPYDQGGCLHQGKWRDNAVEYLNQINYFVDFDKRGHYQDQPSSFLHRQKNNWMLVKTGLKGSYWDLMKRIPLR